MYDSDEKKKKNVSTKKCKQDFLSALQDIFYMGENISDRLYCKHLFNIENF